MNYLELINNFWREDEQWAFTPNETRVYFYLLHLANRNYWAESFVQSDRRLIAHTGVSIDALRTARHKLKNTELIDFVLGGKGYRVKTRYRILTPKTHSKATSNIDSIYKTKNKTNNINKSNKDEKFSRRAYIASGSDFDE